MLTNSRRWRVAFFPTRVDQARQQRTTTPNGSSTEQPLRSFPLSVTRRPCGAASVPERTSILEQQTRRSNQRGLTRRGATNARRRPPSAARPPAISRPPSISYRQPLNSGFFDEGGTNSQSALALCRPCVRRHTRSHLPSRRTSDHPWVSHFPRPPRTIAEVVTSLCRRSVKKKTRRRTHYIFLGQLLVTRPPLGPSFASIITPSRGEHFGSRRRP